MKNRISILLSAALMISLIAYGCTASGSVGTNKQQNQTSAAPRK